MRINKRRHSTNSFTSQCLINFVERCDKQFVEILNQVKQDPEKVQAAPFMPSLLVLAISGGCKVYPNYVDARKLDIGSFFKTSSTCLL